MGEKTAKTKEQMIEFVVAIMLGVTAVATAWSSWQGGLHGSQMDQKYTISNNLASEGNSEYNAAIQMYTLDSILYNEINGLMIDQIFADSIGDTDEVERLQWKIDELFYGSVSEELAEAFYWAMEEAARTGESVSPFEMEGFIEYYFEDALELLYESEEILEEGHLNNTHSDNQGLVSVLYAVVLFMLGISTSFKRLQDKYILLGVAAAGFLGATIFMLTIPIVMP